MEKNRMDAIVLANSLIYASPTYSARDGQKKQKIWNKFINSMDWDYLQEKNKKKTPKEVRSIFGALGIPMRKKKGDN